MIPIRLWSVVVSHASQPRGSDRGPSRVTSLGTGAVDRPSACLDQLPSCGVRASAMADDGRGRVAPGTAAISRTSSCVGACADIESAAFTSGWSATLQSLGRERGPLGMAGARGAPKASRATGWFSFGEGFDGRGVRRIELPRPARVSSRGPAPGRDVAAPRSRKLGATLGELRPRRAHLVDGGDALWTFGR